MFIRFLFNAHTLYFYLRVLQIWHIIFQISNEQYVNLSKLFLDILLGFLELPPTKTIIWLFFYYWVTIFIDIFSKYLLSILILLLSFLFWGLAVLRFDFFRYWTVFIRVRLYIILGILSITLEVSSELYVMSGFYQLHHVCLIITSYIFIVIL